MQFKAVYPIWARTSAPCRSRRLVPLPGRCRLDGIGTRRWPTGSARTAKARTIACGLTDTYLRSGASSRGGDEVVARGHVWKVAT
jgi:hypothetical protein